MRLGPAKDGSLSTKGLPRGRHGGTVATQRFRVAARVSSADLDALRPVLEGFFPHGSVRRDRDEILIEAEAEGEYAKDLNRSLLSALRKVERRTRIRAEWTSPAGTVERYFDYVLKQTVER